MKFLLTLVLSVALLVTGMAQTVRRVNNNPGVSGVNVYATLQAAHDASVANDILIVEPSPTSYTDLTLTKPLKIYGNGYFLDTNTELKVDTRPSTIGNVFFNTGSGGSEIYGVVSPNGFIVNGVSNITISRCNISYGIQLSNTNKAGTINTNVSNILINRNFLKNNGGSGAVFATPTAGYTISNVFVNNNIVTFIGAGSDPQIQSWVVRNNTFVDANTNSLVNSVFENNFLAVNKPLSFTNVSSSYNVSVGVAFSGGLGNVNSYDVITNSELVGSGAGISLDEAYQIKAGSDLKTLGNGGIEVGAYGGSTPYVVSGIPPIPSITTMTNSGSGDNSNPLKVNISVKSNN